MKYYRPRRSYRDVRFGNQRLYQKIKPLYDRYIASVNKALDDVEDLSYAIGDEINNDMDVYDFWKFFEKVYREGKNFRNLTSYVNRAFPMFLNTLKKK